MGEPSYSTFENSALARLIAAITPRQWLKAQAA